MQNNYYMIQMTDTEAAKMLQTMAKEDLRSYGNQVAYLIRQEWVKRLNTEHNSVSEGQNRSADKA